MGKQVVVSGARGFLGKAASQRLLTAGHQVFALGKPNDELADKNSADANHISQLALKPGFTFLAAGWSGVASVSRDDYALQDKSLENFKTQVLDALEIGCGRIIGLGTQAEMGVLSNKTGPVSRYARNKVLAHEFLNFQASLYGVEQTWVRVFSVYGPGMLSSWLPALVTASIASKSPLELGPCSQKWGFLHISDFSSAIQILTEETAPIGNVIDLGYPAERSLRKQLEEIFESYKMKSLLSFSEGSESYSSVPDLTPMYELGWKPEIGFAEGIANLLNAGNHAESR